jgi:hypothetical protein
VRPLVFGDVAPSAEARVKLLDEWRVLYANGNEGFTRFTPEEAQRVADEDNQGFPGCGARVVRVALVDENALTGGASA